jgi:hypothetical protein
MFSKVVFLGTIVLGGVVAEGWLDFDVEKIAESLHELPDAPRRGENSMKLVRTKACFHATTNTL